MPTIFLVFNIIVFYLFYLFTGVTSDGEVDRVLINENITSLTFLVLIVGMFSSVKWAWDGAYHSETNKWLIISLVATALPIILMFIALVLATL